MKNLILSLLLIFSSFSSSSNAVTSDDGYFIFDSPKQIELSTADAEKIADKLLLEDEDGYTYDAVVNIINNKTIAISPIEQIESKVTLKGVSKYKIRDYSGNIYVQNKKNLKKISSALESSYIRPMYYTDGAIEERAVAESAQAPNSNAKSSDTNASNYYSKTNVQTKGIDEADIVKTDGKNIYYVKENELIIVDANAKNPSIKSVISLDKKNNGTISNSKSKKVSNYENYKILQNVYIDNYKLSLIYTADEYSKDYDYVSTTVVDTYDVSDASNPKLLNSNTIKGYLKESRKKGDIIYITTTDSFNIIYKETSLPFLPSYSKTIYEYDTTGIDLTKMLYTAFNPSIAITKITSIDINDKKKSDSISYMGSSDNIYMSENNLYISSPAYNYNPRTYFFSDASLIKKFAINNMNFKYIGSNQVDGQILNKFSLNETNGNLFVAYTKYDDFDESSNNLISFDKNMKKISELSGLAKGERIYSARYMKDKAYIVTFKQVDPLFVIDIKNPKEMQVLGYLKIPGYSNYLHPYKDNYLIGFGQNTANKGSAVVNDGFKISLFDISDFNNPKEVDVENIGKRGSYSTIEHDHKALMFDEKRNIFSIPVYVTKAEKKSSNGNIFDDIIPTFIGAYVYNISEKGFDLKGRITHYTDKDINNTDYDVYEYSKKINRSIQIGDNLYTISDYGIKVNDINTLNQISELKF